MDSSFKAIIGLGNPGDKFYYTRHNIGFRILDALADRYGSSWRAIDKMEIAQIVINEKQILLIKPQTFMNSSGEVLPYLQKKGIKPEEILVVHDELELPFGAIKVKLDGSSKGHNGLKSIISFCGSNFYRLRVGIGRPEKREMVPDYVLKKFDENSQQIESIIIEAINEIEKMLK